MDTIRIFENLVCLVHVGVFSGGDIGHVLRSDFKIINGI